MIFLKTPRKAPCWGNSHQFSSQKVALFFASPNSIPIAQSVFFNDCWPSAWWFQPLWKICSSKWEPSPNRGENSKNSWVATTQLLTNLFHGYRALNMTTFAHRPRTWNININLGCSPFQVALTQAKCVSRVGPLIRTHFWIFGLGMRVVTLVPSEGWGSRDNPANL